MSVCLSRSLLLSLSWFLSSCRSFIPYTCTSLAQLENATPSRGLTIVANACSVAARSISVALCWTDVGNDLFQELLHRRRRRLVIRIVSYDGSLQFMDTLSLEIVQDGIHPQVDIVTYLQM